MQSTTDFGDKLIRKLLKEMNNGQKRMESGNTERNKISSDNKQRKNKVIKEGKKFGGKYLRLVSQMFTIYH